MQEVQASNIHINSNPTIQELLHLASFHGTQWMYDGQISYACEEYRMEDWN